MLLVLAVATLVYLPAGTVGVRSWRGGGTASLVGPGLVFRFPGLQRVQRFPDGQVGITGTVVSASREGATVDLPYTVSVRPQPSQLLGLAAESGGDARRALAAAVEIVLKETAAVIGTQELASGSARDALESRLIDLLHDRFPGADMKVRLGTPDVPAAVRASFAREAVYGHRRETGLRVVLIGWDGADWDAIDPLIRAGELPNLARLRRDGVWARLRSSVPTLSPLLWTTVATGKSPDRHGINDFLVLDPASGRRVPINSTFRRARAFWNILSDGGIPVDVIAWWATWPAEPVRGHLVSDRVAYTTFNMGSEQARSGAVYPPTFAATVERLRVPESGIDWRRVRRFLDVDEAEFAAARRAGPERPANETQQSINVFVRVLAATETYRQVALELLRKGDPGATLFAVYFQGIDEVNHRFAHCAPPRAALCSDGDYRRFHRVVDEFYRFQDEILGEILAAAPGATVLLLSDHGFASGDGRPDDVKPFIEGKPGLWHDLIGIFAAGGPGIGRGEIPTVTLYDIAPTLLHLVGLPVADDMPGKVLERALTPEFIAAHPVQHVPSFEGLGGVETEGESRRAAEALASGAEEEMVEQLRSLGYIGG
ncbi:MAG TPA: alkaline phosphatase family protein, partial [Candidatus Polarisedimenticolia bacterium]|nr:alkaline phosphatase family protein [Candidatus Polarisedimenticolia bacterium]